MAALTAGGALAACWSGAGPSLLGICRGVDAPHVQSAAEVALAESELPGEVLVLRPDLHGLIIDDADKGLYDFDADQRA
jgi:homoserine kinase